MRPLGLIALTFIYLNTFAQNESLDKVKLLIDSKKYESAINLLNETDPDNENPELVIAKSELLLNYFVTSIMHQLFAMKDLNENEELMEIRGSQGNFAMYYFPVDSILSLLIEKNPENFKLHKTLGYYYHEVHLKYPEGWLLDDSIVINKFLEYYKIAYQNEVYDDWSLYGIGYAYLTKQDYKNSTTFFEKSLALNDKNAASYYNLAYAYLYLNEREKTIEYASKAMELYNVPELKADAARIIAVVYSELENREKALEYFSLSNDYQPNNYYTLKQLLFYELFFNKDSFRNRTKEFFLIAPDNPTIYQNLMEIYWQNNKPNELITFLQSQLSIYEKDFLILGNLYFYIANNYFEKQEFKEAKMNFEKARDCFAKVFEKEHPVFEAINSYVNDIK